MDRSRRRRCISEDTTVPHPLPVLTTDDPQASRGSDALAHTSKAALSANDETTALSQARTTSHPPGSSWLSRAASQRWEHREQQHHIELGDSPHATGDDAHSTGTGSAYQLLRQFFDVWRPRGSQSPAPSSIPTASADTGTLSAAHPPPPRDSDTQGAQGAGKQRGHAGIKDGTHEKGAGRAGLSRANRAETQARTRSYTVGPSNPATGGANAPTYSPPDFPSATPSTAPTMTREELLRMHFSATDNRLSSRGSSSSSCQTPVPPDPYSAAQAATEQQHQQQGKTAARTRWRTDSVEEDARFVLSASGLDLG